MILDTSAVIAVLCREPGWEELLRKIEGAATLGIGAPTVGEANIVATSKRGAEGPARVARFLEEARAVVVPFGADHLTYFNDVFRRFGKGRHPAALNIGDCFTYAVAKGAGMPVLCVGDDFPQTDLALA